MTPQMRKYDTASIIGTLYFKGCRTQSTIDMCFILIPMCRINILNPSLPIKSRLHTRFGSTMMKYNFTSPLPKVGVKGKVIHI